MRERQLLGWDSSLTRLGFSVCVISTLAGLGVASFQIHLSLLPHDCFAAIFFLGGVSYFCLDNYVDWKYQVSSSFSRKAANSLLWLARD